jgi:hypothetical protein
VKGTPVDAFFYPATIRPGSIVETGDVVSLTGQSAPLLPAHVAFTVTSPTGTVTTFNARANRIGYLHDPAGQFAVNEAGEWRVTVTQTFDGAISSGTLGDPLPASSDTYRFFAVDRNAPALRINRPPWSFVRPADGPVAIDALVSGLQTPELSYVVWSSGYVLEEGTSTSLEYRYDLSRLAKDFLNLDLEDQDGHAGVDVVVISLMVTGKDIAGNTRHSAQQVLLRGEELIVPQSEVRRRSVRH